MAKDAPDGVLLVAATLVVGAEPVSPETATEALVFEVARKTTSSTEYQTVVTHTVTIGKVFILTAVEMESDNYTKTHFKLVIGDDTPFEDQLFENPYSPPIPALKMAAGSVVTLSCKSTDGTEITVDGDLIGKEIG